MTIMEHDNNGPNVA